MAKHSFSYASASLNHGTLDKILRGIIIKTKEKIVKIIKNGKIIHKDINTVYLSTYQKRPVILKLIPYTNFDELTFINEIDTVNYLCSKSFPTYKVIDHGEYDGNFYLLQSFIDGINGFNAEKEKNYFYSVGKLVALYHKLIQEKLLLNVDSSNGLCHGDLHSGNIIINTNQYYILDFSSIHNNFFFVDLLNFEFELSRFKNSINFSKSLISGYKSVNELFIPSKQIVIEKILESDKSDLDNQRRRGNDHTDYFLKLESSCSKNEPSFVPPWDFI